MKEKKEKFLLALMPFWTPLIPPQGIARIKGYLRRFDFPVKTVDLNLERGIKDLYSKYFEILKKVIPEEKRGNFFNIGNDVWRDHMMAHFHRKDKREYIGLVKELIFQTFFFSIEELHIQQLNTVLERLFALLKDLILYWLEKEKPDIFGISVYRDTLPASMFAFKLAKEKYPHIKTIMGGGIFSIQLIPQTPNMEIFLEKSAGYIDKIFIGEGEKLLLKYVQGELDNSRRIYSLEDLHNLGEERLGFSAELPDISDFNYDHYNYLAAQASTSCPFQCSFCNVNAFYGKYQMKDPVQTVAEMKQLWERYQSQLFFMLDALLNPVVTAFSKELIRQKLSLYWDGYLKVDQDACNLENILMWRRAGFYRARIGIETGSQRVLDMMNKRITVDQIKQVLTGLAFAGIKTTVYLVIGHPGETEEDFRQTLELLEAMKENIWEAECNPFTYMYTGQWHSDKWASKRELVYPEAATDMLVTQTWKVNIEPSREEMFRRVNRFVQHCKKLNIPTPYSLFDVQQADERWRKLHKNSVPSILQLIDRKTYIEENKDIGICQPARNPHREEKGFAF